MSVLQKLSSSLGRRDQVPNQELAKVLAEHEDRTSIQEIAEGLWHEEKNIRGDCLKVLYEIGYLRPDLIEDYTNDFLRLLNEKNNRLVWGGMIALAAVAPLRAEEIGTEIENVIATVEKGSVITQVWGMRVLAHVAVGAPRHSSLIFPFLLDQLKLCKPRDVPTHTESILPAITAENKDAVLEIVKMRRPEFTAAHEKRMKKVLKKFP